MTEYDDNPAELDNGIEYPTLLGCEIIGCGQTHRAEDETDLCLWVDKHTDVHRERGEVFSYRVLGMPRSPILRDIGGGFRVVVEEDEEYERETTSGG